MEKRMNTITIFDSPLLNPYIEGLKHKTLSAAKESSSNKLSTLVNRPHTYSGVSQEYPWNFTPQKAGLVKGGCASCMHGFGIESDTRIHCKPAGIDKSLDRVKIGCKVASGQTNKMSSLVDKPILNVTSSADADYPWYLKKLDLLKGIHTESRGSVASKLNMRGSAIDPVTATMTIEMATKMIGWAGQYMKDTGIDKQIEGTLKGLVDDFGYVLSNPDTQRYKNIYVNRIPRLGQRYMNAQARINNHVRMGGKKPSKWRQWRINRLKFRQEKLVNLTQRLLMQLPRIAEYARMKDNVLLERTYKTLDNEINKEEAEWVADDDEETKGEGMEGGLLMAGLAGLATADALARPFAKKLAESSKTEKGRARNQRVSEYGLLGLIPPPKTRAKKGSAVLTYDGTGVGNKVLEYATMGLAPTLVKKAVRSKKGSAVLTYDGAGVGNKVLEYTTMGLAPTLVKKARGKGVGKALGRTQGTLVPSGNQVVNKTVDISKQINDLIKKKKFMIEN